MKNFFKKILFFLPLDIILSSNFCFYSMYHDNTNNKWHSFFDDNHDYKIPVTNISVNMDDKLNHGFLAGTTYDITSFGFSLNGNNVSRSDEETIVLDSDSFINSTDIDINTDSSYEEEEAIIKSHNDSISDMFVDHIDNRNKFVNCYYSIEVALSELLNDRERTKIYNFYRDMKEFSIPLDSSYIVLLRDREDNYIYLIMAFDPVNKKIYFKRTDTWYRFDIYQLKNEIRNNCLGLLADAIHNDLNLFEKIELCKDYAYDCEKNICYYPKKSSLSKGLMNKSRLPNLVKKFSKIIKSPKLKKKFLEDLHDNFEKTRQKFVKNRNRDELNKISNKFSDESICNYLDPNS